jgi:hypothetical protein
MFYTVAAAAEATGLSKSTILGSIESGQLTATRDLCGEWAIDHSDLNRLYLTIGERSIDGAPQSPAPDAANIEAESEDLPEDDGDSLGQSCDEGHREPYDACNQGPALQRLLTSPVRAQWSAASAQPPEVSWALPSALIAATLLAALGLCWIWGRSSSVNHGIDRSNLVGIATAEHAIKIRRGGRRATGDDLVSADRGFGDEAKHNRRLDGP